MSLKKPYLDVPGTVIFDAEQSRKGYWLNQFCMSLMQAENRRRFKADERAYLDAWPMTEEQKQAVMARDLNWCIRTGGNFYVQNDSSPVICWTTPKLDTAGLSMS